MAKIGIVTVLYNSEKVINEFFSSLNSQTFKDFTLYVVDNASTDNGLILAKELASNVKFKCVFISEEKNWGVAKGNNIGIKLALQDNCQYILLSNNDVVVDHPDTLEVLYKKIADSDIDILCPKIYYYYNPEIIWAAGGTYIKYDTGTYHYGRDQKDVGLYDKEREIRYTPTCFVLIRANVFDKIGFMDEWYFVYYDDTDFMYRAWKYGLKIYYIPWTSILHNESASTGAGSPFKQYYLGRNQLYFVRKNRPFHIYIMILAYRFSAFSIKHIWTRERSLWKAELKGLWKGLRASIKGV